MFSRITFLVFLIFWLVMSYLLWRSEYAMQNDTGSAVPASLVWRKIVNAPDSSSLQVIHNGKKVGYCRWTSSVGQDLASGKILGDDSSAAQLVQPGASATRMDLDGNVFIEQTSARLQFRGQLVIETNNDWQEIYLRLALKPNSWEIHSSAKDKTVRIQTEDEQGKSVRSISFADLQNPAALLRDFDTQSPLGLLAMMNMAGAGQKPGMPALGLDWKAHNDWVSFGHTSVRAFRLDASVLQRYHLKIIVSRVGEILRIDLPDGWVLVNDQLLSM